MADYNIRLNNTNNFTVTQEKNVTVDFLSDLADVNASNLSGKDQHVLIYDAALQKYTLVPADQVLSTAASDNQLPNDFIDQLDVDLDNKIDLDGGTF